MSLFGFGVRPPLQHQEQLTRIRQKLVSARKADPRLKVFGARSHKYRLRRPASEAEVSRFEQRYSISLPDGFREFLLGLGNGGAGPFYGILPLADCAKALEDDGQYLAKPAMLRPDLTKETWTALTKRFDSDQPAPEGLPATESGSLFSGILGIGSQGCTYVHGLMLEGAHRGRVVNLDLGLQKPRFAFETTFLDWYERWLDEVIAGILLDEQAYWFGYTMGGSDEDLMRVFETSGDLQTKTEALSGLSRLRTVSPQTCQRLLALSQAREPELRRKALPLLAKFAYAQAVEPLQRHLAGDDADCLAACQSLWSWARERARDWFDALRQRLPRVGDAETFRFMAYLLVESGLDFGDAIKPFCFHQDEAIRRSAFYTLGKLPEKERMVEVFAAGMRDPSPPVVHASLQAAKGLRDGRLIEAAKDILARFETDEMSILTNLELLLKPMGYASLDAFRRAVGIPSTNER